MKKYTILILLVALLLIQPVLSAEYSFAFDSDDEAHYNQSYSIDPKHGQSSPFIIYILSGICGLCLLVISLIRSKTSIMDYEINIILSVMSWPFIGYFSWSSFNSVDYITGSGVGALTETGQPHEYVMMTGHILYTFPILGVISAIGVIVAAAITVLFVAQYKLMKSKTAENSESTFEERQPAMKDQ